jgi:hypothetical protein
MPEESELDDESVDPRGLREAVERANREAAEAKAALADMQLLNGFRDAGLDLKNPLHKAVADGFTGKVDEIGSFVAGLGLQDNQPPAIPTQEQETLNRIAGLPTGDGGRPENLDADGNARLKQIADQARRERWGTDRFNSEFSEEMQRQGRPVAQMDIVETHVR